MNYSKDSRKNSNESDSKKNTKKKVNKSKLTALRVLLIAIIIGGFALIGAGLGVFIGIIRSAPDVSTIDLKPTTDYTSFIYDANGNEIDRLSSGQNRIYATLDQIPLHLQHAVIVTEDERFYEHNGIDIRGIFRSIFVNFNSLFSGGDFATQGASTITQQLIKNNVLTTEKKITRKIQEQYLAIELEKQINDKELILEYYLNTMPLGQGTNGVQAASHRYYNKDVSQLTLAESVVIAGITQYPTRYDPTRNPDANWEKAQIILRKMFEQGYITESEYEQALQEDPYENIQSVNQKYQEPSYHTYFVDAVIDAVLADLQEQGMSLTQANNLLFGGGVNIYTTFDPEIQFAVDSHMEDDTIFSPIPHELKVSYSVSIQEGDSQRHLYKEGIVQSEDDIDTFVEAAKAELGIDDDTTILAENILKIPQPQAAFVVMDHTNGHVKALSGGRGDKVDRDFNRATLAQRQPGSTFKLLAAYAPALDLGIVSPGTIIVDEKISIPIAGQPNYEPTNWYTGFKGPMTVREGVWNSVNILAVKTLDMVGIDVAFSYLENFGFTTLVPSDRVYSLALGGLTNGVTPLELNAAYATIANGGTYIEPILYTKVTDRDGNTIIDKVPETRQVISESTAYMLTNLMQDVVKSPGTGASLGNWFTGMSFAGKTGTTNDGRDYLFAGYSPYYTSTVWLGFDQPKKITGTGSNRVHLELWGKIMNDIHQDLPYKDFDVVTTGYSRVTVCGVSGMLPTDLCRTDSSHGLVTDYFHQNNMPTEYCTHHAACDICTVSGKLANAFCPSDVVIRQSVINGSTSNEDGEVNLGEICDVHTEASLLPPEDEEDDDNIDDGDTDGEEDDDTDDLLPWFPPIWGPDDDDNDDDLDELEPDDNADFFIPGL